MKKGHMKIRSFSGAVAMIFLLAGVGQAAEKPGGKLSIRTDRDTYRVGDMMKLTIAFDNVKNPFGPYAHQDSFVSFPEITLGGIPVERVPLYRLKRSLMSPANGKDNPFIKGEGEINVAWLIERKTWRDETTGEVIYDGVGIEAGWTSMGTYLYMLEKVPGEYGITLNWVINPGINRADYNVDLDRTDARTSNTITVKILPGQGGAARGTGVTASAEPKSMRKYWEYWVMPDRDMIFYPDKVIKFMGLKSGEKVADIGAGSGYFTFKFAKVVGPEGRVYAIDNQFPPELDAFMRERISDPEDNPYHNVDIIKNSRESTGLAPKSVDVAFMCLDAILLIRPRDIVYPSVKESYDIQLRMVSSVFNSMKPGGRLVVIDLIHDPAYDKLEKQAGMSYPNRLYFQAYDLEDVKRNFAKAGFRFVESSDMYMNEEHEKNMAAFRNTKMYDEMGPSQRFFQGRKMFLFLFEKPEDGSMLPEKRK
jgi:predicted methyltransferase